jgi:hypothetical protein
MLQVVVQYCCEKKGYYWGISGATGHLNTPYPIHTFSLLPPNFDE